MKNFDDLKYNLQSRIEEHIISDPINRDSYKALIKILVEINIHNRKQNKGRLSHFVVDSYSGSTTLGAAVIDFDDQL